MAKPKRHVSTAGANRYIVSEINPNDTCGGHCACGQHPPDQQGPYIVFPTSGAPVAGRAPRTVICAPCAKSAVLHIETGGEIAIVGAGSPTDKLFDGGEPDAPEDYQKLKARYESTFAGTSLMEIPEFPVWLAEQGYGGRRPKDVTTGIDPNAKSILEARAASSPTPLRGGPAHGRIDDPVEQVGNADNWGHVDDAGNFVPGSALTQRP